MFFNMNLIENDRMCNTFTLKNEDVLSFVKETEDRTKIKTVEMAKLDVNKPLIDMNEQEKMIYYFLNCYRGKEDSKIKVMIESDGVVQMLEKRVETISDDGWKKIIEDFQKLHENEERMERQLELEEIQRLKEEIRKTREETRKIQEETRKIQEETRKKQEEARKLQEANKHVADVNRQIEQMNQVMKLGIKAMLTNGMSLEYVSKLLSKSESEIMELVK